MQHMAFGSSTLHSTNSRASVSHHDSPQDGGAATSDRWAQVEEAPEYHQTMHTGKVIIKREFFYLK